MKLAGKIALVTGASQGVGAGIAERLAADGATVVVTARDADKAGAVVARIEKAGGTAVAIAADLSKVEEIDRLFAATKERFGRLDLLVNNAGLFVYAQLDEITPEQIDRHFALNFKGLLLATQAAVRLFPESGGVVVNVSSGSAQTPLPSAHVYSATKGAVDVLTRSLAVELGPRGIRVVAVAPGFTDTEGVADLKLDESERDAIIARTPLGRIGRPSDIAAVVAFLASDDGGWITGETLQAGGGNKM